MRVGSEALGGQLLARGERDGAIDPESTTFPADHHIGGAAFAVKVFGNVSREFVRNAGAEGFAHVDMFTGDLNLHELISAPDALTVKSMRTCSRLVPAS